ncbi:hypothetical protein Vadar_025986 [Vaccinium darrowii]|uniref:Uncharacterized protein n=1 Tax=Vaccinium darrowii TaxID=229202 RepID=A0ACB7XK09_9ERIC|nr:hypothetical protein Vadar_025986 [Vaccinium darrowii]
MPTHTSRMTLADDVYLEEPFMTKEEFSGADIKAKCTEVGLLALRERHMKVMHADIKKAKDKVMFKKKERVTEGLYVKILCSLQPLSSIACFSLIFNFIFPVFSC